MIVNVNDEAETALRLAIAKAKHRGAAEVAADDLLLGALWAASRFGTVALGRWIVDLEALGIDWVAGPPQAQGKVAYSDAVVQILDRAASLARLEGAPQIRVEHLLVPFAREEGGLMAILKARYGIDPAGWRAALAGFGRDARTEPAVERSPAPAGASNSIQREYLSPEEAAEFLGVHVQTIRGYIRSRKLEALRIAGERAIRIRRSSLEKLLEPLDTGENPVA